MSKNKNQNKFNFVNQNDDFLIEDNETSVIQNDEVKPNKIKKTKLTDKEVLKLEKKRKRKKLLITAAIMFSISIILIGLGLLFQYKLTLMAIGNAVTLTCVLIFFGGWIMAIWNQNVLSPLIHGIKTFGLMLVGKRPELKYYDYMMKVKNEQIPKYYIFSCFITAGILLIPSVILTILTY